MSTTPLIINTTKCDIRNLKAGACVSSIHRTKNMDKGRLASAIKAGGGQRVQDELYQKNSSRDLNHGEVVLTSPGDMSSNFKHLMFVCLYRWKDGNGETVKEAVTRCLTIASENGLQSIAFPALGMGGQHYPPFEVAKNILTAVIKFSQDQPRSSVTTVYIALYDRDINSIRTFLQISMAVLVGYELGRETNNNDQVTLEGVDSFNGLQNTKPVQNAQRKSTQAIQSQGSSGQVTFAGNGISCTKQIGILKISCNANASLSNFIVAGGVNMEVDLSKYVPRPVKFIIQKIRDFF